MLLPLMLIILFSRNIYCQQSIFEPSTYSQSSCTGTYQWTSWFDTNDPDLTQGDAEVTNHIQQMFPDLMCTNPTAIEAQTSIDTNPTTTGDLFKITAKDGFLCLNPYIPNYKTKLCTDYKVRFCCPKTTL